MSVQPAAVWRTGASRPAATPIRAASRRPWPPGECAMREDLLAFLAGGLHRWAGRCGARGALLAGRAVG